jgi:hypothetical protein
MAGSHSSFCERHAGVMACLAALHLALVCLFIWTSVAESPGNPLARTLRTYKNLSGIFRDYRFFAPSVSDDTRVGFYLERADGTSELESFSADNREVDLRYNCIVSSGMHDNKLHDILIQSWAAGVLGSHPEAARVTVIGQAYQLPSLQAFADGAQPRWKTIYAGTFDRRAHQPEVTP